MNKRYLFFALTVAALTTLALGLTLPAHPARAQNPTPAPTPTLYWYEDCAVNSSACGERVAREFGFLPFVLGALARWATRVLRVYRLPSVPGWVGVSPRSSRFPQVSF